MGDCQSCPSYQFGEDREETAEQTPELRPTLLSNLPRFKPPMSGWWKPQLRAFGTVAPEIEDKMEVLPQPGTRGKLGGDSCVSIVIGGGSTGTRSLWIFADTFISKYDAATQSRVFDGYAMPHSTLGLMERKEDGSWDTVDYIWRTDAEDNVASFFEPTEEQKADGQLLWPVSGIASRDGTSVVLLAQRIKGFLNVVGTTIIVIKDVDKEPDPRKWNYTTFDVGTAEFSWFSAIFFAEESGDTVHLFGHGPGTDGQAPNQYSPTLLARTSLNDLLEHAWDKTEFWTEAGWKSGASPCELKGLNIPSWETTVTWNRKLNLWYSFNIEPFGKEIFLWTCQTITGEWQRTKVFDIPAPFNTHPWLCYAAKQHPEFDSVEATGPQDPRSVNLVVSWIANSLDFMESTTGGVLFAEGQMRSPDRGYWTRFVRVTVANA